MDMLQVELQIYKNNFNKKSMLHRHHHTKNDFLGFKLGYKMLYSSFYVRFSNA